MALEGVPHFGTWDSDDDTSQAFARLLSRKRRQEELNPGMPPPSYRMPQGCAPQQGVPVPRTDVRSSCSSGNHHHAHGLPVTLAQARESLHRSSLCNSKSQGSWGEQQVQGTRTRGQAEQQGNLHHESPLSFWGPSAHAKGVSAAQGSMEPEGAFESRQGMAESLGIQQSQGLGSPQRLPPTGTGALPWRHQRGLKTDGGAFRTVAEARATGAPRLSTDGHGVHAGALDCGDSGSSQLSEDSLTGAACSRSSSGENGSSCTSGTRCSSREGDSSEEYGTWGAAEGDMRSSPEWGGLNVGLPRSPDLMAQSGSPMGSRVPIRSIRTVGCSTPNRRAPLAGGDMGWPAQERSWLEEGDSSPPRTGHGLQTGDWCSNAPGAQQMADLSPTSPCDFNFFIGDVPTPQESHKGSAACDSKGATHQVPISPVHKPSQRQWFWHKKVLRPW